MGKIDDRLAQVEQLARELVPSCFDVDSVILASAEEPAHSTPFAVVLSVRRRNDKRETAGWAHELMKRIRLRWRRNDVWLTVREEPRQPRRPKTINR